MFEIFRVDNIWLLLQVVYGTVISLVYYGYFTHYIRTLSKKDKNFPFKTARDLFPTKQDGEVRL